MAFRFIEADEEVIELLKSGGENKNTKRSTDYWKGIFEKWARIRGKKEQLERYDFPELNEALSQFYAELRKENGQDYEPDSLKVMQAALDRYLRNQNYPKVNPEGYRVPVVKESVGRKGEKPARTRHGKTTKQSKKPDQGSRGDTMGTWPVR